VNSAPSEDLKAVLQRLADLQARMSSLEAADPQQPAALPSQMFESQNLRDTMMVYEQQQASLYENFIGGAGAFATDIVEVLDQRFFPRIDAMFAGAKTGVAGRMAVLTPDRFAQQTEIQLTGFETRFAASIEQFATVREEFSRTERKIVDATERLDAIWADQDPAGMGGWRLVMRSVAAFVEKNKEQQPVDRMERIRGQEEVRAPSPPAILNLSCPKCHQQEVRRLHRETLLEEVLRVASIAPYRCRACGEKFYRMRYASGG
jgi:hypothetical protein